VLVGFKAPQMESRDLTTKTVSSDAAAARQVLQVHVYTANCYFA